MTNVIVGGDKHTNAMNAILESVNQDRASRRNSGKVVEKIETKSNIIKETTKLMAFPDLSGRIWTHRNVDNLNTNFSDEYEKLGDYYSVYYVSSFKEADKQVRYFIKLVNDAGNTIGIKADFEWGASTAPYPRKWELASIGSEPSNAEEIYDDSDSYALKGDSSKTVERKRVMKESKNPENYRLPQYKVIDAVQGAALPCLEAIDKALEMNSFGESPDMYDFDAWVRSELHKIHKVLDNARGMLQIAMNTIEDSTWIDSDENDRDEDDESRFRTI